MLQIVTKRFFPDGVELRETVHRRAVHTNAWFLDRAPLALPVGTLTGSSGTGPVSTAWIEVSEFQPTLRPDGTEDFFVATCGDELVDDLAYVVSFALNVTVSRD